MTLLYTDPVFLEHDTGAHPENAGRLRAITRQLLETGRAARCVVPSWTPVAPESLQLVHAGEYVRFVRAFAERGGGRIEVDTMVSPHSYDVALRATGAVVDAVERVVRGEDSTALCLVRPPGHHARPKAAMGFCLFNNIAAGARHATARLRVERVLIVDWDVHHGNGTQEIFWTDGRVGFLSIHRYPFYPGTGAADEVGAGDGLGATMNLPIAFGTSRPDYLSTFQAGLERLAVHIRPELVLISAGFDAHREDPIGSLGLETEDFGTMTDMVTEIARQYAGGRIVSVLEGGYHPERLAESVALHLDRLLAAETNRG